MVALQEVIVVYDHPSRSFCGLIDLTTPPGSDRESDDDVSLQVAR